ncbi:MAG: histidine phosphatase family protein [Pseudomonadota bacterium]
MKRLYLLRHAKSSWDSASLSDHDRQLNDRGRRDAPRMGAALAARIDPQLVHCSSAVRARQTLEGVCEGWPALAMQVHEIDEALYTFDYRELMEWMQRLDGAAERCFLIGHNPGLTDLCNQLVGRLALDNLPTAGFLSLSLPVEHWSDVTEGIASLEDYLFPRSLS